MVKANRAHKAKTAIRLIRRALKIWDKDTQKLRADMIEDLKDQYKMACEMARGEAQTHTDEEGKQQRISPMQRKEWMKVATEIAKTIDTIATSFDTRQIDKDLEILQALIDEASTKAKNGGLAPPQCRALPETRLPRPS